MEIKYVDVNEIKNYENNAKLHTDKQIDQITNSIKEFGFNDPIALDENNVIIEGHGRLIAAKKLNLEKIPCIYLKHLDVNQKRAYMLAHNKLTMNTDFDLEKLKTELLDLQSEEFNLDLTGFRDEEIEDITADLDYGRLISDILKDEKEEKKKTIVCPKCDYEWENN